MLNANKILWIVPTRGRSDRIADHAEAFKLWTDGESSDLMYIIDGDWEHEHDYYAALKGHPFAMIHAQPWRGLSATLNFFSKLFAGRYGYIGFMGDDHFPRSPQFDGFMLDCLEVEGGVVSGRDGSESELCTYWAMDSRIITVLGHMVPEVLRHNYVDNYVQDLALGAGCYNKLPEVLVEHMHPLWAKGILDESYELSSYHHARLADARNYEEYVKTQLPHDVTLLRRLYGL